ncbi:hypothetical protein [Leptospira meyeri]|uniref:hypothetical protein n=1 Tax=Leptospira meyeri TaxID=29508 RepID=UPI0010837A13|nr:hypothetical protein [Leptospira meyeri]TGL16526.1 hypothetical protein EHQ50_00095 [Leptospira meyeri]
MTTKVWQDSIKRMQHPNTRTGRAKRQTAAQNDTRRTDRQIGMAIAISGVWRYVDISKPIQLPTLTAPETGNCNNLGICIDAVGNHCTFDLLGADGYCETP